MAEIAYRPFSRRHREVRLIVRRTKPTPGTQRALLATYDYHAFVTNREGDTIGLDAGNRRHGVCEVTIRDLKYGVGLNHLPSGRFAANAAWMAFNLIAHNLGRWTERIGLGRQAAPMTTKTHSGPGCSPCRAGHHLGPKTDPSPAHPLALERPVQHRARQPARRVVVA